MFYDLQISEEDSLENSSISASKKSEVGESDKTPTGKNYAKMLSGE
jgi:hypothetical protein